MNSSPYSEQFDDVLNDLLPGWSIVTLLEWIAKTGCYVTDVNDFTQQLAIQMFGVNAPIVRLRLSIRTNNKEAPGWSAVWQLGQPFERDRIARPGFLKRSSYLLSPVSIVDETQQPYRVKLDGDSLPDAHIVLRELAAQGATDYIALPLHIVSSGLASIVLVTDRLGGFTDEDIKKFSVLSAIIAPTFEMVFLLSRTARTNAYE